MYLEFCSNGMSTTFSNVNSLVETSNFENRRKVNTLNCLFWGKTLYFGEITTYPPLVYSKFNLPICGFIFDTLTTYGSFRYYSVTHFITYS